MRPKRGEVARSLRAWGHHSRRGRSQCKDLRREWRGAFAESKANGRSVWEMRGGDRPRHTGPLKPWGNFGFHSKCSGKLLEDFKHGSDFIQQ